MPEQVQAAHEEVNMPQVLFSKHIGLPLQRVKKRRPSYQVTRRASACPVGANGGRYSYANAQRNGCMRKMMTKSTTTISLAKLPSTRERLLRNAGAVGRAIDRDTSSAQVFRRVRTTDACWQVVQ